MKKQIHLRVSIRSKFILGYVVIGLIPIIIFGVLIELSVEEHIENSIFQNLESVADSRAQWINTYYEERSGDVFILSTSPTVQSMFQQYIDGVMDPQFFNGTGQQYLSGRKEIYEYVDILFIDKNGIIWWSVSNTSHKGIDVTNERYNQTNLATLYYYEFTTELYDDVVISDFQINEFSDKPTAFLASLVYLPGQSNPVGLIAIQISNNQINDIVQDQTGLGLTGETYLVGQDYYMRSNSRYLPNGTMLLQQVQSENVQMCFHYQQNPEEVPWYDEIYLYRNYRDVLVVGTHAYIPDAHVALIAEIERTEAYEPINATKINLLLMTAFFITLILVVSFLYSRSLIKPIKQLMDGSKIIGEGNLDHRITLQTHDEIQELSDSFNHMAGNLKQSQEKIRQYTLHLEDKVAERTLELKKKVNEIKQYSEELERVNQEVYQTNSKLKDARDHLRELNEQLEQKVKERTAAIEQLLKQKDEFIGHLGHDLKTPLSVLINLVPIMEEKIDSSLLEKDFSIVMRNIEYISKLVHQTLEIAKLSSSQTSLKFEPVSLASFVSIITDDYISWFAKEHITLTRTIDESIQVRADPLQLRRVVENLVSNAVKAMPEGGTISITTEESDKADMITVSIADTGIGIPPDQQDHIFQEFYKIDESRHHLDSTGLGLSISKRIVEQHGGRIWVESQGDGNGAIFKFTLPIISSEEGWSSNGKTSNDSG